jgi:ribokinase
MTRNNGVHRRLEAEAMSNSAARVIVAGSINMDIVAQVDRHPVPGETLTGSSLSYSPGGKGANQAVAASRAGADVVMIGAVGDDAFAPDLIDFLKLRGVNIRTIKRSESTPTGTALITVDSEGENSIVVIPGANATLDGEYVINAAKIRNGDVLLAQFETPLSATISFFAGGIAAGATCILNPAPAATVPTELLTQVDVLIVNETELGVVSGEHFDDLPAVGQIKAAYERLRKLGFTGCLVATLGARGVVSVLGARVIEIPGRVVNVVDTTGAGDCFVGYLAACLALGQDMDKALCIANTAASLSVQCAGAGPSMPEKARVDGIVKAEIEHVS